MAKKYDSDINEKFNSIFATRLRTTMESKGYNQVSFSEKVTFSRQSLSSYCTGSTPANSSNLLEIANVLNVSVDYLLGLTEVKSPNTSTQAMNKELGLSEISLDLLSTHNSSESGMEGIGYIFLYDTLIKSPHVALWILSMVRLLNLAKERNQALIDLENNPVGSEVDENGYMENMEFYSDYEYLNREFEFLMWKVEQEFHKALENICKEI